MIYYKWRWYHDFGYDPVLFYVELDDERWNTKILEIYKDRRQYHADERHEHGTFLGKEPYLSVEEINDMEEFFIEEITYDEFKMVWDKRTDEYFDKELYIGG